jgi:hypothetical protein
MRGFLVCQWLDADRNLLHGTNLGGVLLALDASLGPVFPEVLSPQIPLYLFSTSPLLPNPFTLTNVRFFIQGDDEDLIINAWPALGGGLEISVDRGATWIAFGPTLGNPAQPEGWIPLSGKAVGTTAADGVLAAGFSALILLRMNTPASPPAFGLFRFELAVAFDVW